MAVPQDSCQAGIGMSFGKVSQPVVTSAGKPFLSGVGPSGREVTASGATPVVFASPIAAWQPVIGATKYQVEMSRTLYPWHPTKHVGTPATSVVLPVTKFDAGTWYYRVRGFNTSLPKGAQAMAWSKPIQVKVTGQPDRDRQVASAGPWARTSDSRTSSPTRPTRSRCRASARSTCTSRRSPT